MQYRDRHGCFRITWHNGVAFRGYLLTDCLCWLKRDGGRVIVWHNGYPGLNAVVYLANKLLVNCLVVPCRDWRHGAMDLAPVIVFAQEDIIWMCSIISWLFLAIRKTNADYYGTLRGEGNLQGLVIVVKLINLAGMACKLTSYIQRWVQSKYCDAVGFRHYLLLYN